MLNFYDYEVFKYDWLVVCIDPFEQEKYTIVIVTHNLFQARRIADDCIFMLNGKLWEQGTTEEIFSHPQRQETKDYLQGAYA